jgi:hypothetical protein
MREAASRRGVVRLDQERRRLSSGGERGGGEIWNPNGLLG